MCVKVMSRTSLTIFLCLMAITDASDPCTTLVQCQQPIRSEGFFADQDKSMIFKITDQNLLNRVCGKLPTLRSCVNTNIGSCADENTLTFTNFFKDIIEFTCTPAGRTVALATASTSCVVDQALDQWFIGLMHSCTTTFVYDIEDAEIAKGGPLTRAETCPYKIILDTCVKTGMDNKCGPEMANMIEQIWHLWSNIYYAGYNCGQS